MLLYFFIIFLFYYLFIGMMVYGWNTIKISGKLEKSCDLPYSSIIIAVRNEEKNIHRLLTCIAEQSVAHDQFEVILIDDNSEDRTVGEISKFLSTSKLNLHLLKNDSGLEKNISPKKNALRKGIDAAKGEVMVMTDGDCWFEKDWLISMISAFKDEKTMFVSGPVALKGEGNLLSSIQSMEFSSLIGTGAAMISYHYPLMCNGANVAFRKTAFFNVNGYHGNETISSGDDVFLMQKIHSSFRKSVSFIKDQRAIVASAPQSSISDLIHQRKRWASKWNQYQLPFSWLLPVFLFIHYISFLACIVTIAFVPQFALEISILIALKFFLDYYMLKKVMVFCKLRFQIWIFLLSELLYPFYALLIGILVHFKKYHWKGRIHNV